MLMLNFSNKELVQQHLVQGISWNCIPGIRINIESLADKNLFSKDMEDKIPIRLQLSEII